MRESRDNCNRVIIKLLPKPLNNAKKNSPDTPVYLTTGLEIQWSHMRSAEEYGLNKGQM